MSHVFWPCGSCGAINRVKVEGLLRSPICARCKSRLSVGSPVDVNEEQFDKVVLESGLPVLVDFWAPWCGPCRAMHPVLEKLAEEHGGSLVVARVNTDENTVLSARYGIQGVPTLILFQEGRELSRQVGAVPQSRLESMLLEFLG